MNSGMSDQAGGGPAIAIIGGGFSGAMLCVQLLRQKELANVEIVLIERGPALGRGVAYSTPFEGHLLNVRAENMSAYPDMPDHFVNWPRHNHNASVTPDDFLSRPLYGQYIVNQFENETSLHPGRVRRVQGEAVSLRRNNRGLAEIWLSSGQTVIANKVVLATGHFPPANLPFRREVQDSFRYFPNPWALNWPPDANEDGSVLLIGTGLTSVDVIIELRARGFDGTIHMLSRRGLLPQSHRHFTPVPPFWTTDSPRTARELLHQFRLHLKAAEASGSDWCAVVDSLRSVTHEVWQSLPLAEQKRFLRHLRTYWEVHRHRIAESIAEQLAEQIRTGKLQVHAGRVTEYREDITSVHLAYRDRESGETRTLRVERVVNCTGPDSDLRKVGSPLLTNLFETGLALPDQVALGLDVADDGAVVDAQGQPSPFLYTVGPLRKGKLFESIAVPELRVQIADLAKQLAKDWRGDETEKPEALTEAAASIL
jgi:uncharacterized NAD(P)/FAD-binding protein YdhS